MPTATATIDPCTETYQQVEKLILQLVRRYSRNEDQFEENLAEANFAFMRAYNKFDGSRGFQFTTYLYWTVSRALQSKVAREMEYRKHECSNLMHQRSDDENQRIDPVGRQSSYLESLCNEVGDDARLLIHTILDSAKDMHGVHHTKNKDRIKHRLWEYLKPRGWSVGGLLDCYEEIAAVLR